MAFSLAQSIQNQAASQENQFFTNLMQYAMNSSPEFDVSGRKPQMITPGGKLPPKSALWNEYVRIKKGRVSATDLMRFEQAYKQAKGTLAQENIKKINQLGLRGYSNTKIQNMMEQSPEMYQNLLDMISEYESMGTEDGMAAASALKGYLPGQGMFSGIREGFEDRPIGTGLKTAAGVGAVGALGYYGKRKGWGKGTVGKARQWAIGPEANPRIAEMLARGNVHQKGTEWFLGDRRIQNQNLIDRLNAHQQATTNPSRYRRAQNFARTRGLHHLGRAASRGFGAEFAGFGTEAGLGLLGASPETASRVGSGVTSGLALRGALTGLRGLSAVPHPVPKALGYAGLAAYGLYKAFKASGG